MHTKNAGRVSADKNAAAKLEGHAVHAMKPASPNDWRPRVPGDTPPKHFSNGDVFEIIVPFNGTFPEGHTAAAVFIGPENFVLSGAAEAIPLMVADKTRIVLRGQIPWNAPAGLYRPQTDLIVNPPGGHPEWKGTRLPFGDREDFTFYVDHAEKPPDPQPAVPQIADPDK